MLTVDEQLDLIPILKPQIVVVRQKIFELAKQSSDIETMHWYMWLDDCFENNEFSPDELDNLQWRCFVLKEKEGEKVNHLLGFITPILRANKLIDAFGQPQLTPHD